MRGGTTLTAGVTIPVHGGEEIGPPLLFRILKQMGISPEEFQRLR
jgi:predicted RNA binding protein YcfA (HicA-like mRNA interferase family)